MMVKQTLSEKCSALGFHADVFTIKILCIWACMIDLTACSLYKPRGLEPKQLIYCLTVGFDGSNCLLIFRRHTKRRKMTMQNVRQKKTSGPTRSNAENIYILRTNIRQKHHVKSPDPIKFSRKLPICQEVSLQPAHIPFPSVPPSFHPSLLPLLRPGLANHYIL